jgi:hypothetical protein
MVVHDVEENLDARAVQRLDHVAKLVDGAERLAPGAVSGMWRKEGERLVPPIISEPRWAVVFIEGKYRQQFDRAYPEILQMGYFFDQSGVGAPFGWSDPRARVTSEAGDMHFVNDRFGERSARRRVAFPIIGIGIDDHASQGRRGIIAGFTSGVTAATCRDRNALAVSIEQDLLGIKPEPVLRIEWPCYPVAVDLTRPDAGHEHMPIVISAVPVRIEVDDPGGLGIIYRIEQQELGRGTVLRKYAEIGSAIGQGSTEGKTATSPIRRRFGRGIDCALRQVPQHEFADPGCCHPLQERIRARAWRAIIKFSSVLMTKVATRLFGVLILV